MKKEYRVLSLGAGVQSSTMALMFETGQLSPPPDVAIFADTQAEPQSVYDYLEYIKRMVHRFPIVTCSNGSLVKDVLRGQLEPPFFIYKSDEQFSTEISKWVRLCDDKKNEFEKKNGMECPKSLLPRRPSRQGMLRRQCTASYKIKPIQKAIRVILGYKKYQRVKEDVTMLIGISTDEIQRVKDSRIPWIKNEYPLIDLDMSRSDCLKHFDKMSLVRPPRSACYMCPYKNDNEWVDMRDNSPDEFKKAVKFDRDIRTLDGEDFKNFLHKSCVPLGDVLFRPKKKEDQLTIFSDMNNECDGMCGV